MVADPAVRWHAHGPFDQGEARRQAMPSVRYENVHGGIRRQRPKAKLPKGRHACQHSSGSGIEKRCRQPV
jgi:hypothetical protein